MSEFSSKIIDSIENVINKKNYKNNVPLHEPYFKDTNAWNYVKNCIDSGWVSSSGNWVNKFEEKICLFTGAKYSILINNGTSGLRLALHILGVKENEEVLIPPFSFVATANAISHLGAFPHFIDIEEGSLSMCPKALTKRLNQIAFKKGGKVFNRETGRRISALMPVHVFGVPANLSEILKISRSWDIPIVEDAAEALGSWFNFERTKIHCGLGGDLGVISFNGNKLITTGGGGVIITNNSKLASKARHLSTTAKIPHPWEFDHDEIAWNDRLPNLNAALGLSQLEVLEDRLFLKRKLLNKYIESLDKIEQISFITPKDNSLSNNWLITIALKFDNESINKIERDILLSEAHKKNIFLRPLWKPLHKLKMYKNCPKSTLPLAEEYEYKIINLPSSPQLIK